MTYLTLPDTTATQQNFTAWFAGSVVTDSDGHPQLAYHGTNLEFSAFSQKISFFSALPETAYEYGEMRRDQQNFGKPRVIAAYLAIKNPLRVDACLQRWNEIPFRGRKRTTDGIAALAKHEGHDGAIFSNVLDSVCYGPTVDTVIAAFLPSQIWIIDPNHLI